MEPSPRLLRLRHRSSTERDPWLHRLRWAGGTLVAGLLAFGLAGEIFGGSLERRIPMGVVSELPRTEAYCEHFLKYERPLEPYERASLRGCLDAERDARSGRFVVVAEFDTVQMRFDATTHRLATRYAARLEEQGAEVRFEQPDTGTCCLDCGPAPAPAPDEAYRQSYFLTSRKAFDHQVLRPQQTSIYAIYHETLLEVGLGG